MAFDPQSINKDKAALYGAVFNNPNGQEVIKDLMQFVGYMGDPFAPADPHVTSYNCGQRRVVSRVLNLSGYHKQQDLIKLNQEENLADE